MLEESVNVMNAVGVVTDPTRKMMNDLISSLDSVTGICINIIW